MSTGTTGNRPRTTGGRSGLDADRLRQYQWGIGLALPFAFVMAWCAPLSTIVKIGLGLGSFVAMAVIASAIFAYGPGSLDDVRSTGNWANSGRTTRFAMVGGVALVGLMYQVELNRPQNFIPCAYALPFVIMLMLGMAAKRDYATEAQKQLRLGVPTEIRAIRASAPVPASAETTSGLYPPGTRPGQPYPHDGTMPGVTDTGYHQPGSLQPMPGYPAAPGYPAGPGYPAAPGFPLGTGYREGEEYS